MVVATRFTPVGGAPEPLQPGGRLPGPGIVLVEVRNATAQPADLPSAADADAGEVARALDAVRLRALVLPGCPPRRAGCRPRSR